MSFGQIVVELDGFRGGLDRGLKAILRRKHADDAEPVVIIRDPRVSECIVGIGRDRAMKADERFRKTLFRRCIEVVPSAEIVLERFRHLGAAFCKIFKLTPGELRKQHLDDLVR